MSNTENITNETSDTPNNQNENIETNTTESKTEENVENKNNETTIKFKETALFSTYLFALVVGPHDVWEDKYNDIPLRIFCRKTLSKYIDPENLFKITIEQKDLL